MIYARSDIQNITVSPAMGGCGLPHHRPAGLSKSWGLDCSPCEGALRTDPNWAPVPGDVPPTVDETRAAERLRKAGSRHRDELLAAAMARLAGISGAPGLAALPAGARAAIPGVVECPDGHPSAAGVKFCAECGKPMRHLSAVDAA